MSNPTTLLEQKYWAMGKIVAGIDEAGRGALAGPVVAAAVILPETRLTIPGVDDSKKLSAKKRELVYEELIDWVIDYSVGRIEQDRIDKINILNATFEAMQYAAENLKIKPNQLLIDGNRFIDIGIPYDTIIEGDAKTLSIAAASIIAKVTRDQWMIDVADMKYPEYHFASNKGYGTKQHFEAIEKYGTCPLHRKTFLRKFFDAQLNLF